MVMRPCRHQEDAPHDDDDADRLLHQAGEVHGQRRPHAHRRARPRGCRHRLLPAPLHDAFGRRRLDGLDADQAFDQQPMARRGLGLADPDGPGQRHLHEERGDEHQRHGEQPAPRSRARRSATGTNRKTPMNRKSVAAMIACEVKKSRTVSNSRIWLAIAPAARPRAAMSMRQRLLEELGRHLHVDPPAGRIEHHGRAVAAAPCRGTAPAPRRP